MINGLFHLYEHIIVHKLIGVETLHGFTAEDYIFLYFKNFSPSNIIDCLQGLDLNKIDLDMEKRVLSAEFERERNNEEEHFFRTIWQGTGYEKSPLGDVLEIEAKTTTADLAELHEKVMKHPQLFYEKDKGLTIVNQNRHVIGCPKIPGEHKVHPYVRPENFRADCTLIEKRVTSYKEKTLKLFFFKGNIEPLYIMEKYLREQNPGKMVQISEKKEMSVFIIEEGCFFPAADNIGQIKKYVLAQLKQEIKGIKENFVDRALNELESMWFYDMPWTQRCDRLLRIPDEQLLKTMRSLNV